MPTQRQDKRLVEAFVCHLAQGPYPRLTISRFPDMENRDRKEIDAIAGDLAIEHTSIDTVPDQRRDDSYFMQVVRGLRQELQPLVHVRLTIGLDWTAVHPGQDWPAIRAAFRSWIVEKAHRLADGDHAMSGVPGIPFGFRAEKESDRPPRVVFRRTAPDDDSLPERVRDLVSRKADKLESYAGGYVTVLLLESSDLALMNRTLLVNAIARAFADGLPSHLDEVWYADTSVPEGPPIFRELTPRILHRLQHR
jgi:hypothetical protein